MTDTNNDPQQVTGIQEAPAAEAPKKGWMSRLFNSKAASFVMGVAISAGVKTVVCSLLASTSAPALIGAAAAAGAVKGALAFIDQRKTAIESGKDIPDWKDGFKTVGKHAAMSTLGALTFGLLDDSFGLTDKLCDGVKGFFNIAAVSEADVLEVPEVVVTPAPESIEPAADVGTVVVQPAPVENLSAQELKDRGYCKFNGFCDMDKDQVSAVEDFKAADAMGNSGAGIDLAYSEYWGKGGLEMNKEHAIEKMQDVLEKMREAGKGNTAEYHRGEDLLDKWLGIDDSDDFQEDMPQSEESAALLENNDLDQAKLDEETAKIQHEALENESKSFSKATLEETQLPEQTEETSVQAREETVLTESDATAVSEPNNEEEVEFSLKKCDHISMTYSYGMAEPITTCTMDNVKGSLGLPDNGNVIINPGQSFAPAMR